MTKAAGLNLLLFLLCRLSLGTRLPTAPLEPRTLYLLDVDSTLYRERDAGIEAQVVANTHQYCQEKLGLSMEQADDLFRRYGSTIEGVRRTIWQDMDNESRKKNLKLFYQEVYRDIDMSSLLSSRESIHRSTGYSHPEQEQSLIHQLLKGCPHPLAIASNSPSWHVQKVLQCMGLFGLEFDQIMTPDSAESGQYPTKHQAKDFFDETWIASFDRIKFFDDSLSNLDRACAEWEHIEPIHLEHDKCYLSDVLLRNLGLIDADFEFDAVKYLECKNRVDGQSIHVGTWNLLISQLRDRIQRQGSLMIVDLGAGRLNILSILLHGEYSSGLNALLGHQKQDISVQYIAYESNAELLAACQEQLLSLGFRLVSCPSENEYIYSKWNWNVRLLMRSFDGDCKGGIDGTSPDLLVGCCFADLMHPRVLVSSLLRSFGLLEATSRSTLVYFPITFAGQTQFLPPSPFEHHDSTRRPVPSDTFAFQTYSRVLSETLRHNLDTFLLEEVMADFGCRLLSKGASNWNIDPITDPYLADTMMYFFGRTAGPSLLQQGLDAPAWIRRARKNRPRIQVSNIDFLFAVGSTVCNDDSGRVDRDNDNKERSYLEQIQFVAPENVTSVRKQIPDLKPCEVLIESVCSLISSGTELKVFKGSFENSTLDLNFDSMQGERLAYPLSYGYCLVGRIIKCGSNVAPEEYLGRLAFTFSAHATHVVCPVDSLQLVPHGISALDAIFMPSIETAISLVHDAHLRVGENVAIYGQGLIGLLVTAVLRVNHCHLPCSGTYGIITAFDTLPDRLAASSRMGATQALLPGGTCAKFDVTIEVSGNVRALQSAIDSTADGGRVIVGSWYGSEDVALKLGIDFHRSQKKIRTSQVSKIPAGVSGRWDKKRRFGLAWDLVRDLRPSRLLTRTTTLGHAMDAYRALDRGTEIAVAFEYDT